MQLESRIKGVPEQPPNYVYPHPVHCIGLGAPQPFWNEMESRDRVGHCLYVDGTELEML